MDLDSALQQLKQRGTKLTPQRLQILRILLEAEHPVTAREVAETVWATQPHVSLDTIYRNLAMLTESGLVTQINLQNRESTRFEFQGEGRHHHHFVCLTCGTAFCVESCPAPAVGIRPPEDPGFKVMGHAFEVYGYCSHCQSSA